MPFSLVDFYKLEIPDGSQHRLFRDEVISALTAIYRKKPKDKIPWKKIRKKLIEKGHKPEFDEDKLESFRKHVNRKDEYGSFERPGDNKFYVTFCFWLYFSPEESMGPELSEKCKKAADDIFKRVWKRSIKEVFDNLDICKTLDEDLGGEAKGKNQSNPTAKPTLTAESEITEPTAPFKWPDHIPEDVAFSEKALEGVWLNPHNHHSITFSGRKKEKALLEKFIRDDRHFLIGALVAPSGAGKTRLVSEFMKPYMAKHDGNDDWDAGFVESREISLWSADNWTPTRNTLIIIDYTYNYDEIIDKIIERFKNKEKFNIRLLMLDHVLPEKLHEDFVYKTRYKNQIAVDGETGLYFDPHPIILKPEEDDSVLLRDIIASSADPHTKDKRYKNDVPIIIKAAKALMKIGNTTDENPTQDQIRRRDSIRHPLFAALIGQILSKNENEDFSKWTRRDLITYYFEGPRRVPWIIDEDNKHAKALGLWTGCYVSAATLLRGAAFRDLRDGLPTADRTNLKKQFSDLKQYCNRIVAGGDNRTLRPFEPDILGEAFFLKFVEYCDEADEENVINALAAMLASGKSPEQQEKNAVSFLETLQRLVRNLINDDQQIDAVRNSWQALILFLEHRRFRDYPLMRQAVSIALVDMVKQCRISGLDHFVPQFAERIELNDLCAASSGEHWLKVATCTVHYYEWMASGGLSTETHDKALVEILKNCKSLSKDNWSAITVAAYEGCLNTAISVYRLFGEDINSSQSEGWTILMVAARYGYADMVGWLIEQGVDPNLTGIVDGATALMVASQVGHLPIVKHLLANKAKINQGIVNYGWTALMAASAVGHLPIVKHLLDNNANVNQCTLVSGRTALMTASAAGHLPVVKHLLDNNADVNQCTMKFGRTALMTASLKGHLPVVEYLIANNANVNQGAMNNGETALMSASHVGHLPVVKHLLDNNANVNQGSLDGGWTALMAASQSGHLPVVKHLLDNNANVNQGTSDDGWTALMAASQSGHLPVVEYLISKKADVDQGTTDNGTTALMLASQKKHESIVALLNEKLDRR